MSQIRSRLGGLCFLLSSACGSSLAPPDAPLTTPALLCFDEPAGARCRTPEEVESWLHDPGLRILGSADTAQGIQGAKVLTLSAPTALGSVVFRAKWRAYATRDSKSDPRKELGAYAVQSLFLKPGKFVVPPTAGHCFELSHYRATVQANADATMRGTRCVYGVLSYWLEDARSTDVANDEGILQSEDNAFDQHLFNTSASYRQSAANVNILTYLIDHGDSHKRQFVLRGGPRTPWLYEVDNSVAFGTHTNPEVEQDWSQILVPALPRASIERLKRADPDDLAVIEQYENVAGLLRVTRRTAPGPERDAGLRLHRGQLQIGLTRSEIRGVAARRTALLTSVGRQILRTY
jgi:hypothetical protein